MEPQNTGTDKKQALGNFVHEYADLLIEYLKGEEHVKMDEEERKRKEFRMEIREALGVIRNFSNLINSAKKYLDESTIEGFVRDLDFYIAHVKKLPSAVKNSCIKKHVQLEELLNQEIMRRKRAAEKAKEQEAIDDIDIWLNASQFLSQIIVDEVDPLLAKTQYVPEMELEVLYPLAQLDPREPRSKLRAELIRVLFTEFNQGMWSALLDNEILRPGAEVIRSLILDEKTLAEVKERAQYIDHIAETFKKVEVAQLQRYRAKQIAAKETAAAAAVATTVTTSSISASSTKTGIKPHLVLVEKEKP